jgi:hypothetical protein
MLRRGACVCIALKSMVSVCLIGAKPTTLMTQDLRSSECTIVPEESKSQDVAAALLGITADALVCKPACKASQAPPRFRSRQKLGVGQGQTALAPYPPAKYINAVDNTDKLKCSWPPLGSGSFGTVIKVGHHALGRITVVALVFLHTSY